MEIEGYLAETAYPPHLPAPFAPAWIDHVLRHAGLRPNRGWRGPFRYLDVGCGAGLHLVAFAAAYPEGQFVGTDANGAAMARAAAIAAGVDVRNVAFRHETFAETLAHGEGGYDYMAALGVLSWVSSENRDRVMRIAGRQLAPGGAAAFGYNALPGRAPELLPQRLMVAEARRGAGAQTDAIRRVLDRLERLAAAGARGLTAPRIAAMLSARRDFDPDFLPHEYLSEHWAPLDGGAVVAAAEAEGLRLAGSLTPLEIRPDFLLRRAEREIVDMAADAAERARLTDLCIDQAFRRDLFVKADGAASGPDGDALFEERLDAWFLARAAKADVVSALETPAGRLRFDNAAARGIVAGLQAGPARLGAIDAPGTAADRLNALDALLAPARRPVRRRPPP
ncbi:MAG: class I SAM-dependent methyltransferase, partial [Alphaproteobacteria bacterium]